MGEVGPIRRRWLVLGLAALVLPASAHAQTPATVTAETARCAAYGAKRPGNDADRAMAAHLRQRFDAAGLQTSYEDFHLPIFTPSEERIEVVGAGARRVPGQAFAYSGTGSVEAEVVDVGVGRPSDYTGKDVKGKIVLVERNESYHRSSQLNEIVAHGGAAMLYVSGSPNNLVQAGAVRFAQDLPAPIPTVTVGADDGKSLRDAPEPLRMRITVRATREDRVGRNVIGIQRGTTYPDRYVVIAGHYDSWYGGAIDNCSSMGSLLQILDQTRDLKPAYTIVWGAWDAEEVGLVGSYDWVRRHQDLVPKIVLNENLEMVSAATYVGNGRLDFSAINLIFGTSSPAMNALAYGAASRNGFTPAPTTANGVRSISGGIIPTDLQPFYTQGVQGFSTFSSTPYYHPTQESPDKIDPPSHVRATSYLRDVLRDVQNVAPEALALREVPRVEITAPPTAAPGASVPVEVRVTDPNGEPVTGVAVKLNAQQRDWWPVAAGSARELGGGRYRWDLPAGATEPDLTHLTATVDTPTYAAQGFGAVDQRATTGALGQARCVSRRAFTIRLRVPRGTRSFKVTSTAGKLRLLKGRRQVRIDLRGTPPQTVRVTVTARTRGGRTVRDSRRYRTCVARR